MNPRIVRPDVVSEQIRGLTSALKEAANTTRKDFPQEVIYDVTSTASIFRRLAFIAAQSDATLLLSCGVGLTTYGII